ncbi:MAG TPA: hypothetical protein VK663_09900 [Burkholderiales bacterium]|nr:hypothetical protein [Burkholderiales bacterium]
MTKRFLPAVSAVTLLAIAGDTSAQTFPTKPLRIIVPAIAGSAPDVRVFNAPDIREQATATGMEVVGGRSEDFAAFIRSEIAKWGGIIKDAGD